MNTIKYPKKEEWKELLKRPRVEDQDVHQSVEPVDGEEKQNGGRNHEESGEPGILVLVLKMKFHV